MRSLLAVAALAVFVGCVAPTEEVTGGGGDAITSGDVSIDPDRLLEDEDILGGAAITTEKVKSFLDSRRSTLATFRHDEASAA